MNTALKIPSCLGSYTNSEKERYVCRPSWVEGVHDGYDSRKQAVKMADIYRIEKVWAATYEGARQHGDFSSKRSKNIIKIRQTVYLL